MLFFSQVQVSNQLDFIFYSFRYISLTLLHGFPCAIAALGSDTNADANAIHIQRF